MFWNKAIYREIDNIENRALSGVFPDFSSSIFLVHTKFYY